MGVNCVGKLCENPIHFVCIFIVWRFFWPKILEINRALLKLFMHMKTHFSSISTYRDLSLCNFFFSATLICIQFFPSNQRKGLAYSTKYSQAVTHPSTNLAQCCLTSVIRRELVCSTRYGRRHLMLDQE